MQQNGLAQRIFANKFLKQCKAIKTQISARSCSLLVPHLSAGPCIAQSAGAVDMPLFPSIFTFLYLGTLYDLYE